MKFYIIITIVLSLVSLSANAKVGLSQLFSDNMVLQQKSEAPIWGKAISGKMVTVTTSWDKRTVYTHANKDGKWSVMVSTPKAGGPYRITISDGEPISLENVMIGEVWICSGQSNMDMPVNGWSHVINHEEEIKNANRPNIRLLKADYRISVRPEEDFRSINNGWEVCTSESVQPFSAVAYFFGREIEKYQGVPVGLIQASWGGTPAEAWTSTEKLRSLKDFVESASRIESLPIEKDARTRAYQAELLSWDNKLFDSELIDDNGRLIYHNVNFDDSDWLDAKVPSYLTGSKFDNFDGIIWLRKVIDIPKSMAGKNLKLCLGRVDDNDLTFFNGEQLGRKDGYAEIREYNVPASAVKEGKAVILVRDFDFGGWCGIPGYDDGRRCEIIDEDGQRITLNGIWKVKLSRSIDMIEDQPRDPVNDPKCASVLFNGMVNPIIGYGIKGAIWYQGCDNANRAWQYRDLLPAMIDDWRTRWNTQFPFYIVQLANFHDIDTIPVESSWAELREAQWLTGSHVSNCATACIIDIGEAGDIHPRNKQEVGRRLGLLARANTYGEMVESFGPRYSTYKVEGKCIRIYFSTNSNLLSADGKQLRGFTIAGTDHIFHNAKAVIDGNTVVISSEDVKQPVAVRYGWSDNPYCNLTDSTSLPAVPFRTDDWPGITFKKLRY